MKRKTSKDILAESFREVAERKNIDKITVKDITENCGYSPAVYGKIKVHKRAPKSA